MKTAIVYGTTQPDRRARYHTVYRSMTGRLYVRVEIVNCDVVDALDAAKPLPGETILNSIVVGD